MPYIKKKMRSDFDEIIYGLKMNNPSYTNARLEMALRKKKPNEIDGCINYLFSKLLRAEMNPHIWKDFIKDVIKKVYFSPSYYKLNRLMGLLTCMIAEFKRRSWGNDRDTTDMLEGLRRHYINKVLIPYEKEKRKINGDI